MNIVDQEEGRLTKERDDLEEKCRAQKTDFEKKIDELYTNVESLNTKYVTEYSKDEACKEME